MTCVTHFDNNGARTWEEVGPILELLKGIKVVEYLGATLTGSTLVVQIKTHRKMHTNLAKKVSTKFWEAHPGLIDTLKSLPYDEALKNLPPFIQDDDLRGWGLTDKEINERTQEKSGTPFTSAERWKGSFQTILIFNELAKIGVIERKVEVST